MSAFTPTSDIDQAGFDVCKVPFPEIAGSCRHHERFDQRIGA
jgi:hypothetical protein